MGPGTRKGHVSRYILPFSEQTDACENITLPQVRWRSARTPHDCVNYAHMLKKSVNTTITQMQIQMNYSFMVICLVAGSLESANSSILAARRLFKDLVGKKSGFYDN